MRQKVNLILEGLNEAKSTDGLPCFKAKNSVDRFMSQVEFSMEDAVSKDTKDAIGRVQVLMSCGQKLPSKEIDELSIQFSYDASKDPATALSYIIQDFKKFISMTHASPKASARPGHIMLVQHDIPSMLRAFESLYGVKLDQYFTKSSLGSLK